MRLDRYLATALGRSRGDIKALIKSNQVTLNGALIQQSGHTIKPEDQVKLANDVIPWPSHLYIMLNKPAGYVCALQDRSQRTVTTLIEHPRHQQLRLVGRLDKDTTGLLLMTTDGAWSHQLMAPKKHVEKGYVVTLKSPITAQDWRLLEQGIILKGEKTPCLPAKLRALGSNQVCIWIREGRHHQIKRMFAAIGFEVTDLHRQSIGGLVLDEKMSQGQWRELTDKDLRAL